MPGAVGERHSEQGLLIEVGAWTVDDDGKWCRCDDDVPM